jgi:hypothetical protein
LIAHRAPHGHPLSLRADAPPRRARRRSPRRPRRPRCACRSPPSPSRAQSARTPSERPTCQPRGSPLGSASEPTPSREPEPERPAAEPAPRAHAVEVDADEEPWRRRARAREALHLDPGVALPNNWPIAPLCNLAQAAPDLCVTVDAELFAGYRLRSLAGRRFSEFALDRAELGTALWARPHRRLDAGVILRLEAIRSAGPQSLIGIDGDSMIVRVAQAYGHAAVHLGPITLGVRAGQIAERWIEQLEKGYDTRGVDPLSSDRLVLFDRADLGASLTASGWGGLVELDLALTNGEGRAQEELNRGKNTTALLTVRPWRKQHPKGLIALAVHGLYRDGSYGLGAARAHRGAAALTFASPWAYAGFEFVEALGVREQGDRTARSLGAWLSAYAWAPYLGVYGKYDRVRQDLALADSTVQISSVGLFSDLFGYTWRRRRRLRLYAGYQHEGYGAAAGPVPGAPQAADTHRFLLQLEAQGLARAF